MSDYEQLYRDLRGHIEYFLSERKYWNRPEDIKGYFENTLASSAPATASEGATEEEWPCWKREPHPPHRPWVTSSGGGHFLGDEEPDEATKRVEKNVRQVDCPGAATGVTSSDGDRGLSEEECDQYFRGVAESYKDDEDWGDVMRHVLDLQERLAARTAQPEGVERVEWEHAFGQKLRRRAPGPWEVVGDE